MPGFMLDINSVLQCTHLAKVMIAPAQARVLVGGQPVAVASGLLTVAGCIFAVPPTPKPQPCVRVQWNLLSTRVLVSGQPVLLQASPGPGVGMCLSAEQIPQGPPLVSVLQTRVLAT